MTGTQVHIIITMSQNAIWHKLNECNEIKTLTLNLIPDCFFRFSCKSIILHFYTLPKTFTIITLMMLSSTHCHLNNKTFSWRFFFASSVLFFFLSVIFCKYYSYWLYIGAYIYFPCYKPFAAPQNLTCWRWT